MRIKVDREVKLKMKEEEAVAVLRDKPDISSKYRSTTTEFGENVENGSGIKQPVNKWDQLYQKGIEKVMAMKLAGRNQEDIIFEREAHEYTFSPNKQKMMDAVSKNIGLRLTQ